MKICTAPNCGFSLRSGSLMRPSLRLRTFALSLGSQDGAKAPRTLRQFFRAFSALQNHNVEETLSLSDILKNILQKNKIS
ncbi:hypothetical protein CH370_09760 [Leptospira kmetyi]|nr:hypothetical protein CH370_09760 [Leptospira kmetyi]